MCGRETVVPSSPFLRGHEAPVVGADFLGRSGEILTTSGDGTGFVWDPGVTVLYPRGDLVADASFGQDGDSVATATLNGTPRSGAAPESCCTASIGQPGAPTTVSPSARMARVS